MRRAMLTASPTGVVIPAIGDAAYGGYMAGIIDTTKGNIIAADASQVGARYLLIVSPKSLEPGGSVKYKTAGSLAPSASRTRWDGLTATAAMATSTYPAAFHCAGLAYPADGGSPWYLPAMDELELIYRNLKPTTALNNRVSTSASFPGGSIASGVNPSSDPTAAAYTSSDPARTTVVAFRSGGAQALEDNAYWAATEASGINAWSQAIADSSAAGDQTTRGKTANIAARPVRRILL